MARRTKPRLAITHLLAEGRLTHEQIGGIVGCSTKTVQRTAQELKRETGDCAEKLEEYQRNIQGLLPISDRAAMYVRVAKENVVDSPGATLRALERMDDLTGIVTERDKVKVKLLNTEVPQHQPMFVMPAGSFVRVTRAEINTPDASAQVLVKQDDDQKLIK